jgi:hypothetical protein
MGALRWSTAQKKGAAILQVSHTEPTITKSRIHGMINGNIFGLKPPDQQLLAVGTGLSELSFKIGIQTCAESQEVLMHNIGT